MAVLPITPWVNMDDTRVAVDAPVSTDLMTDMNVNLNYLKSAITDGAASTQGISTTTMQTSSTTTSGGKLTVSAGGADITGDVDMNNNAHVYGNLDVDGIFTISELVYLLGCYGR